MILFYCPDCKEELEAEDSIRGVKMQCPACNKEITVPQASVKVTTRTTRKESRDSYAASFAAPVPGGKFILIVLVAGTIGLLAIAGIGIALTRHAQGSIFRNRAKCGVCNAEKTVTCAQCKGSAKVPCTDTDCKGGKRLNFRGDPEQCTWCQGKGQIDCAVCGGRGKYSCSGCNGTGYLGEKSSGGP